MEKTIISEVKRIHELMGMSPEHNLLLEANPFLKELLGSEAETILRKSVGKNKRSLVSLDKKLTQLASATDATLIGKLEDDILKMVDKDALARNIVSKSATLLPFMNKIENGILGKIKRGSPEVNDEIKKFMDVLDTTDSVTNSELRASMKKYYQELFDKTNVEYQQSLRKKEGEEFAEKLSKEAEEAAQKMVSTARALNTVEELKVIVRDLETVTKDGFLKNKGHRENFKKFKEKLNSLNEQDINFLNSVKQQEVDQMWTKISSKYPSSFRLFMQPLKNVWSKLPSSAKWIAGVSFLFTIGAPITLFLAGLVGTQTPKMFENGKKVVEKLMGSDSTQTNTPVVQPPVVQPAPSGKKLCPDGSKPEIDYEGDTKVYYCNGVKTNL